MIVVRGCAILLFACIYWRQGGASETTLVGIVNNSITLKCDIPLSDPPVVSWIDHVFNAGHEWKPIFSSDTGMDDSHANRQNFRVNTDDFSLTISSLKMDDLGPGNYACRSEVDGETLEKTYNLVVRGIPKCQGDTDLMSGESTTLTCEVHLAGTFKSDFSWVRDNEEQPSVDRSEIPKQQVLSATVDSVGPDDDKAVYKCEMKIADVVEDLCSMTLDVEYGAMDVKFNPDKRTLAIGEELRCTARGNPSPDVKLSPENLVKESKSGDGWRSVVVQPDWVGRTLTVKCSASNSVDGVKFSPSNSVTFNVTEKASTQQSSPTNSTAIIAVVIIVVLIAAAIVILIAICIIRRRRSKKPPKGSKPVPTKDDTAAEHHGTNGQTATA